MNSRGPILRTLTMQDVPAALELSTGAGWNQTAEDWQLLIAIAPQGCLGIEVDGELAASTTIVCYGRQLAWIGMVLTKKEFAGRGLATRLVSETVKLADRWSIKTVKLDATDQGRPIYEKLGFRPDQMTERWERADSYPSNAAPTSQSTFDTSSLELDCQAFGIDRSALLRRLAERGTCRSHQQGFLLTRPGRVRTYIGPCLATSSDSALTLLNATLSAGSNSGWYWDLPVSNRNAVLLATQLGFTSKRQLLRMTRGKDLHGEEQFIYALSGFELG